MTTLRMDDLETTEYFKIPQKLLQPNVAATAVTDALQELDAATGTLLLANGSADSLAFNLWTAIFDIIVPRTAPSQQSKLVEFVVQLQKKTVHNPATGEVVKSDGEVLWTGIPWLRLAAADAWDVDLTDPEIPHADGQRWISQNAFFAQLYAADPAVFDFSIYGLWCFRQAFEEDTSLHPDITVAATCYWVIYAADKLWADVEKQREFEDTTAIGHGAYQKRHWKGYNPKRWAIWQQGLLDIFPTSSGETQKLIQEAVAQIERVAPVE